MRTRYRIDPERGLVVSDPQLLHPITSEFGQNMVAWYVKEMGRLPKTVARNGVEHIIVQWGTRKGQEIPIDELLGRGYADA